MKKIRKKGKQISAEQLAVKVDRGEDVSKYFTNRGKMMSPIQRVNVDFTAEMLKELDQAAKEANVSRQAVIKLLLRQSLNQHYLAFGAKEKIEKYG